MQPDSQINAHSLEVAGILERSRTQSGESISELSASSPLLLVFLRHSGCSFCREALGDIADAREQIERSGTRIALVHMGDTEAFEKLILRYGLSGIDRICDPRQELYGVFGVKRGTAGQLFGPKVLWRGLPGGVLARHGISTPLADSSQMPAIFLIDKAKIVRRFRHRSAADRPDYAAFSAALRGEAAR